MEDICCSGPMARYGCGVEVRRCAVLSPAEGAKRLLVQLKWGVGADCSEADLRAALQRLQAQQPAVGRRGLRRREVVRSRRGLCSREVVRAGRGGSRSRRAGHVDRARHRLAPFDGHHDEDGQHRRERARCSSQPPARAFQRRPLAPRSRREGPSLPAVDARARRGREVQLLAHAAQPPPAQVAAH